MAQKIKKINNEYTKTQNRKKNRISKKRQVVKKRLSLFGGILLLVVVIMLVSSFMVKKDNESLVVERKEKAEQYEALQDKEIELKEQLKRLNDKEYIEKLARSEYFLSNDGEIIFKLGKEEKKTENNK